MCILLSCFTPLFYLPLCPKRSLFTDPPSTYLPLSCEKVRERFHTSPLPKSLILLTEVAVQQTLEGLAVAGLVTGHFIVSPTGRPLRVLWESRYGAVFQPRRRSS